MRRKINSAVRLQSTLTSGRYLHTQVENMFQAIKNTKYSKSDSHQQRARDESDLTWRVLGTLNVFRIFVALILIALFFASDSGSRA